MRGRDGKPCVVCGTTIRAVRVGDGDACFCPHCQRETRKLFVNWTRLNDAPAVAPLSSAHRKIAPAVATLSESAPADIGIVTRWSQPAARRGGQARPLGAEQQGEARGRRKARQRRRARLDHRPDDRDPVAAQRLEIAGPRAARARWAG